MSREEPSDPGLPIKLHPVSNGEFFPPPPSALAKETVRRTRAVVGEQSRRAGLSRRQFLLSSMGSATMLGILAACSSEQSASTTSAGPGPSTTGPGGTFTIPPEATVDPEAAEAVLGGDEFIFDVQGHLLEYADGSQAPVPDFPQSNCGLDEVRDCYDAASFFELMFTESDTSAVVLSAIPFGGDVLSPDVMRSTVDTAERLCGTGRVFMQGQANPSTMAPAEIVDSMERLAEDYPIVAWKTYTHAGGPGWFLDDRDPDAPQVGEVLLNQAQASGIPIVAVHKGLNSVGSNPANAPYSDPIDVGPAAARHPGVTIVVYHSGFDFGPPEGPYDETNRVGVDRLIRSVKGAGLGPGDNVIAELGSTWRFIMGDPTAAAHVLGKLLVHMGEDNVVWGTDSIWYGSPQDQIEAFRAFEITEEFQETFGYPALTPEIKAKVLGLTSARLYDIGPDAVECELDADELAEIRLTSAVRNLTFGPVDRADVEAVARGHV